MHGLNFECLGRAYLQAGSMPNLTINFALQNKKTSHQTHFSPATQGVRLMLSITHQPLFDSRTFQKMKHAKRERLPKHSPTAGISPVLLGKVDFSTLN